MDRSALKGHHIIAQGEALWKNGRAITSPERAKYRTYYISPFQGWWQRPLISQGFTLCYDIFALSGLR